MADVALGVVARKREEKNPELGTIEEPRNQRLSKATNKSVLPFSCKKNTQKTFVGFGQLGKDTFIVGVYLLVLIFYDH